MFPGLMGLFHNIGSEKNYLIKIQTLPLQYRNSILVLSASPAGLNDSKKWFSKFAIPQNSQVVIQKTFCHKMGRLYLTFFHLLILKDSPHALPDTLVASSMGIWDVHLSLHMPAWAEIVYLLRLPICWLDSKLLDVQDGHVFVFLKLRTASRVG